MEVTAGITLANDLADSYDDRLTASSVTQRNHILSHKLTSVLSASYADFEIRDALRQLDATHIQNTSEVRRGLRFDVQKEVIDCNAGIIDDFGAVAEVRLPACCVWLLAEHSSAITADWFYHSKSQQVLCRNKAACRHSQAR